MNGRAAVIIVHDGKNLSYGEGKKIFIVLRDAFRF